MDRFEFGDPQLADGEELLTKEVGAKLYDGDTKTLFENGDLLITSHRLLWARSGELTQGCKCLALPLQYVVYSETEQTSGFGFNKTNRVIIHLSQAIQGRPPGPVTYSGNNYIKVSLREGKCFQLLSSIQSALQRRKWEDRSTSLMKKGGPQNIKTRTGIVGIERQIQEKQKKTDDSISKAFQDLSKLMDMAKDMVALSRNISMKIKERQGDITEDETVRFKSYLLSLGIDDPVTRDTFGSDDSYYIHLGKQLAEMLEEPIKEAGGMMSLTDVYCRVNRARGLDLLSPEDLYRACNVLDRLDLPIVLRKFESGVKVLQLKSHSDKEVVQSTFEVLEQVGSVTAEELAQQAGVSVTLARERLLTTEKFGKACRDESIEGLRFYPNLFLQRDGSNSPTAR